ncbi:hypothetical protein B0T17DRAFT_127530 [Bombardia bombarda]|uniref:Uncharacterized protein n=1 Tax=Bombardia bombarda TaxID=252184 RepID=A0AA39TR97_9PEZI|nr:hypothetical protein B0T17DRAFT_127530 [Bombardia bombarda]
MRQIGIFNAERAEYQEKTHFPGTFVPYLVSYRQGWIRLATYLFKTDTYISLILGQCPTIRPQELNIGLASTSAAYDAGGLGKLFKRLDLEPGGRDTARLCDVLRDPYLLTADMCLVEDVTLGLCGSLSWLWEYRNLARTQPNKASSESGSRLELMGRLAAWKGRLDHISFLLESAALSQDAIKLPLRAYCEPDSERDKRETSIVNNMSERWILACQWWRSADGKEASRLVDRLLNNSIDRQGDALPIPSPLLFITNHVIITFAEADEQFK